MQDKTEASLDLSKQRIDAAGARIIAKALAVCYFFLLRLCCVPRWQYVHHSFGFIASLTAVPTIDLCQTNVVLQKLNLRTTTSAMMGQRRSLKRSRFTLFSLAILFFWAREVNTSLAALPTIRFEQENKSLTFVRLDGNNIGDVGARALAEALEVALIFADFFLRQSLLAREVITSLTAHRSIL